jgi:ATP-binding cassette, subfamily C, bacterial
VTLTRPSMDAGGSRPDTATEPTGLPTATPREARAHVGRMLRARGGAVLAVVALTIAASGATLAGPALTGVVVDAVTGPGGSRSTIDRAALAFGLLALAGAGLQYLAGVRAAVVGESVLAELRTEVFDHALDVPVEVVERAGTGDLVSRVTGDVTVLATVVRTAVPRVVFAGIQLAATVVALALVDWRLAGIAVGAGVPFAAVGAWWYLRHAPARYRAEREAHALLAGGLLEAYRGRRTLTAYLAADRTRQRLAVRGRAVIDAELASASARNWLRPALAAGLTAALVGVIAAGAALVDGDTMTLGAVSAAALYVVRMFDPIQMLLEQMDLMQQAGAATARLVGVTQLPLHRATAAGSARPAPIGPAPAPAPAPGPTTAPAPGRPPAGAITVTVERVSFGYRPGVPVLHGVDLRIGPGERVVLVGPSGAGKTTLGKLICGTHRPTAGGIRLDGRRLDDLDPVEIPRLVAMVAQEGHVFARSVADNVRLARPEATDDDVRRALDTVDALEWVAALPHGTATVVGAGHHRLTPPQAQQLGLARLVCADPAVVILDEATAELDPTAAARTERHLAAALVGRSVLTIAHRLDAAARADRVVVMEAGAVVASGTHAELLAEEGTYAELWARWTAARGG